MNEKTEHYTEGRRWSHISNAWILLESWNDREEIARLRARVAELEAASPSSKSTKEADHDVGYTEDDLLHALAECRDAFPAPPPGGPAEHEWAQAMACPLHVPVYVKAALASSSTKEDGGGGEAVAWMHEFTDPHDGTRRRATWMHKPRDYDLQPGDTVTPLYSGSSSPPSPLGDTPEGGA